MSTAWMFLWCVAASTGTTFQEGAGPADALPKLHEIGVQLSDSMRREAVAPDFTQRAAAIVELCELFSELRFDPRLAATEPLQRYAIRLRSRLRRVKDELEKQLARHAGQPGGKVRGSLAQLPRQIASEQASPGDDETLGDLANSQPAPDTASDEPSRLVKLAARGLSDQLELASQLAGGPSLLCLSGGGSVLQGAAAGAPGGGAFTDFGPDLIELIQRTIDPEFWDVAGGPGTIVYYRPLLALVIRATDEVHEKIGGALNGIR